MSNSSVAERPLSHAVDGVDSPSTESQKGPMHAILLIDHGSRRPEANALLDEVVARVKARVGEEAIVEAAHMEIAEPTIEQGFSRCVERGASVVVAHPFMLAPGRHVQEDLPRLLAEAASSHEGVGFVVAAPLGTHDGVISAIVERCEAALDALGG